MLPAAVQFTDTITLGGVILGALVSFTILVGIVYGVRSKAREEAALVRADEIQKLLGVVEEGREAYRLRAERFEEQLTETLDALADSRVKLAESESRPDMTTVERLIENMDKHASRRTTDAVKSVEHVMDVHDQRAQERSDKSTERAQERHEMQMGVMVEIAKTLKVLNERIT